MKFQIWLSEDLNIGTFTEELDAEEAKAWKEELGFKLQEEFECADNERAKEKFIRWVRTYKDPTVRVKRVNFGALKGDGDV